MTVGASDSAQPPVVPPMDKFRLRDATADDHPTIARLFVDLGTNEPAPDRARFERVMRAGTAMVVGAGDAVCGYVFTQALEDSAYVRNLVVEPEARGRGVGRFAMEAVAERFRAAGCARWYLNVSQDNVAARRLYERCGLRSTHAACAARLRWGAAAQLPTGAPPAHAADPAEDPELDAAFGMPRGLVGASRRAGKMILAVRDASGDVIGVSAFDPGFPGAFPFRAKSLGAARSLLEAMRARREAIDDDELPWRADGCQVVVEDDPALLAALLEAGAAPGIETLHYAGTL